MAPAKVKKQKRKKDKKKSKPLCQTNIFVQCPGTRKSVRKKTDNTRIRRGRLPPPEKSQTQIEIEAEERKNKLRNITENRLFSRDLENRKLELQRRQIDINFDNDRRNRLFRLAELELDREKFTTQTEAARSIRQSELRSRNTELRDIRERVARDDAFRHRQLEEQQRLALEQLAEQRKDNTIKRELEAQKIERQRAVDADRAVSDREREQTLQQALNLLSRQQEVKPIETSSESEFGETPLSAISQTGSEIATDAQSAAVKAGLRPSTELSLSPQVEPEPEPEQSTLSQQQTTSLITEQRSKSLKLTPESEQKLSFQTPAGRQLLTEIQQTERALETYQGLSTAPTTETPLGEDKFTQPLQTGE